MSEHLTRRPQEWMELAIVHAAQAAASQGRLGWGDPLPDVAEFVDLHVQLSLMYSSLVLADIAAPVTANGRSEE